MPRFTSGWIKSYRKQLDSDLFQNAYLWAIWSWFLHASTWKESKVLWEGKQRTLPAGSVVFGYRELSTKFECSKNTIKKWAKYLHDTDRVILETCPRGCVVTILNWEVYQGVDEDSRTLDARNAHTTSTQGSHSVPLIEEVKKERSINTGQFGDEFGEGEARQEEEGTPSEKKSPIDLEAAYRLYPRKQKKKAGLERLKKTVKTTDDFERLIGAVRRYCASDDVKRGFVMHFSTFAGEWEEWEDPDAGKVLNPNEPKYIVTGPADDSHIDKLIADQLARAIAAEESERGDV